MVNKMYLSLSLLLIVVAVVAVILSAAQFLAYAILLIIAFGSTILVWLFYRKIKGLLS